MQDWKDIRARLDAESHAELSALALAKSRDMGDLLREAVILFLADENRKAQEYRIFLRIKNSKGVVTESSRSPAGLQAHDSDK